MKAEARSPSPRNGSLLIPTSRNRMRGLFDQASAFTLKPRGVRERAADVRLEKVRPKHQPIGRGPKARVPRLRLSRETDEE